MTIIIALTKGIEKFNRYILITFSTLILNHINFTNISIMRRYRTTIFDYIILASLLTFMACLVSCGTGQPQQTITPREPSLQVALIDVSGSFKDKGLRLQNYKAITDSILAQGNGSTFIVLGLGNFSAADAIIEFCPKPLNPHLPDENTDEARIVNASNDNIITANKVIQDSFLQAIERNFLQYQPQGGNDFTDIQQPIEKMKLLLNEPRFSSYQRFVYILSDGIHEDESGKPQLITGKLSEGSVPFSLTLSGWSAPRDCFEGSKAAETANADGLFQSIISQSNY